MPADRRAKQVVAMALLALAPGCADETLITNFCPADIVINEIAAASGHDWIELFNADDEEVQLDGFYLWSTDEHNDGFTLPHTRPEPGGPDVPNTLDVGGFLLLIADTYEDEDEPELVLGFDLNRDGGHLELNAPPHFGSAACDVVIFPDQHDNFTWARTEDGGDEWCDAAAPTKGTPNKAGCLCSPGGTSPWC